jgi:hypothetical protein
MKDFSQMLFVTFKFYIKTRYSSCIVFVLASIFLFHAASVAADPKSIDTMYRRIAADISGGKPLTATVYIALCDNDSQGIVPVKNKKICMGDDAQNNLYWASGGGLWGHARTRGWKRVLMEKNPTEDIAVRAVWKKRFFPGGKLRALGVKAKFDVLLVGIAYRGEKIRKAMADYLKAVNRDAPDVLTLPNGESVEAGGKSHVIGWIGHDYFMDEPDVPGLIAETRGNSTLEKGVFGLACISDHYFRPAIQRANVHILALNTNLTFPSAFTVFGMLRAAAAGKDHRGIHLEAVRAFAKGQKRSAAAMMRVFSYGDKEL